MGSLNGSRVSFFSRAVLAAVNLLDKKAGRKGPQFRLKCGPISAWDPFGFVQGGRRSGGEEALCMVAGEWNFPMGSPSVQVCFR